MGLIRFGSPPSCLMTSRIVARSTIAGTPVKSCINTRAGRNAISFSRPFAVGEAVSAQMSSAETVCPSSKRNKFSSITFKEKGRFETGPAPDFSAFSREKYSNSLLPTFNVDCELNVFIRLKISIVRTDRRHVHQWLKRLHQADCVTGSVKQPLFLDVAFTRLRTDFGAVNSALRVRGNAFGRAGAGELGTHTRFGV